MTPTYSDMHSTEIDTLLPTPENNRKSPRHRGFHHRGQRRLVVGSAVLLALVLVAYAVHYRPQYQHEYHKLKERRYKPKHQLNQLEQLTQTMLEAFLKVPDTILKQGQVSKAGKDKLGASHSHHKKQGKMDVLVDEGNKSNDRSVNAPRVFKCTSQLMIMRHCDKDVKTTVNGKVHITDASDPLGNRHCNPKGVERSKYISSLFVDRKEYNELIQHTEMDVPMVSSSLKHASAESAKTMAPTKPQFPAPLKLYALNNARLKKNPNKEHKNFREVETITPLSKKFHLGIDERFGVKEEGELAMDYFSMLSESVTSNVERMGRMMNATDSSSWEDQYHSEDDSSIHGLCHSGMTVVNWKHSRIPILARAFGCGGDEGCPKKYHGSDFDTVWIIKFHYSMFLDEDIDLSGPAGYAVESSTKKGGFIRNINHHEAKMARGISGSWRISADLINEGFDPVY